jgi:fatty acid desaturase
MKKDSRLPLVAWLETPDAILRETCLCVFVSQLLLVLYVLDSSILLFIVFKYLISSLSAKMIHELVHDHIFGFQDCNRITGNVICLFFGFPFFEIVRTFHNFHHANRYLTFSIVIEEIFSRKKCIRQIYENMFVQISIFFNFLFNLYIVYNCGMVRFVFMIVLEMTLFFVNWNGIFENAPEEHYTFPKIPFSKAPILRFLE